MADRTLGIAEKILEVVEQPGHGSVTWQWRTPTVTGSQYLSGSIVGRHQELEEIHQRLQGGKNTAIVGTGTRVAVRGMPGIGKTVLAALYASR